MGKDTVEFHTAVRDIINKHVTNVSDDAYTERKSSKGTYTSITVTITANDKQQLDNIYLDLSACELVNMSL
jgi:putative lipoic acid-binding regulatory protein